MTAATYNESLKRLLVHEGGYSNHPSDPGGPTNYGITIADARRYWKRDATADDVKNMPLDVAKSIYRSKYWDVMRCDELPAGLDYAVFDFGVNSGISRSIKFLENILGLSQDGRPDDLVISGAKNGDPAALINRLCDDRLAFLKRLNTWSVFGAGWGRRVSEVRNAALVMARNDKAGTKAAMPRQTPAVSVGAAVEPPKTMTTSTIGNGSVVAGTAGVAAVGSQIWDKITELPESAMSAILAALQKPAVILCLIVVAAAAYVWWRRRKKLQEENAQ